MAAVHKFLWDNFKILLSCKLLQNYCIDNRKGSELLTGIQISETTPLTLNFSAGTALWLNLCLKKKEEKKQKTFSLKCLQRRDKGLQSLEHVRKYTTFQHLILRNKQFPLSTGNLQQTGFKWYPVQCPTCQKNKNPTNKKTLTSLRPQIYLSVCPLCHLRQRLSHQTHLSYSAQQLPSVIRQSLTCFLSKGPF